MKKTSMVLKRINNVFFNIKTEDRFVFLHDLIHGYITNKTSGLVYQLSEWEDTLDIVSNKETMERINRIKEQMVH